MGTPAPPPNSPPAAAGAYEVDLPAGGKLQLRTQDEVDRWDRLSERYIRDYSLTKTNDLALLGAILSQHLTLLRAQQRLNGMEPETDHGGVPTGRYKIVSIASKDQSAAQTAITKASEEIRKMEQALGIDKVTREAGGQHTVGDYVGKLKKAAHQMGVHIAERGLAYEEFCMELRWKLRMLENADAEDLAYHDLTPDKLVVWAREELAKLEQVDKDFANQKGKVYAGQL